MSNDMPPSSDKPLCPAGELAPEAGAATPLHLQPLSALPPELTGDFLVIVAQGPDRWWDIAWRHRGEDLLDGPWRYATSLKDAEPIAWCRLPAIDLANRCGP